VNKLQPTIPDHLHPTLGSGFSTLLRKELNRFFKVSFQTIAAPVLTAILYLMIFAQALNDNVRLPGNLNYATFLVPGLVMMSVLQNSFANSSSSLIQSKITGNIVFVLLPPLSHWELFGAYVIGAMVRGMTVGLGVFLATVWFTDVQFVAPWWIFVFALLGSAILGTMGLIAGIWAEKFDQIAAFQNFIIMPLTFLAGVFYSVHSLPSFWFAVSHLNPFFYMVDGFRYGFFGVSDVSPFICLAVVVVSLVIVSAIALRLLKSGYKLRY
jgi:ABC-2 type transport system permease protein